MLRQQLSESLRLPLTFLDKLARTANHRYKRYEIEKRGGGTRTIFHPARELKVTQRWLLDCVIAKWPVHESATAYRAGHNIAHNARVHAKNRFLLRMDLEEFFPSLRSADVRGYLDEDPARTTGWDAEDRSFFQLIVCRFGRLAIGAPSSPGLSNAMCWYLDVLFSDFCSARRIAYTRYADDLFFSSELPNQLGEVEEFVGREVPQLRLPSGLRINQAKTRHTSKKRRREVTGLVLTCDGKVSLGRGRKRQIRALIHQVTSLDETQRSQLAGWLAYAKDIEPRLLNSLVLKYGHETVRRALMNESTS